MDRPLTPRAFSNNFYFSVFSGLFILGLLCVQSAGTSKSSFCDLSRQFPCRTAPHICIELSQVRDGRSDCPDGSDEECPEGMHRCVCGLPRCVERNKVGDGIKHCQDGSDEGEDGSNYLCPESSSEENLLAVEMKKRRRRHAGYRNDPVVYPTGLISTFVGTEVNGDQTTLHTTHRYRTYVDGSYTELLESTSVIVPTPTLDVASGFEATANVQRFGSLNSGKVYLTAVNEPISAMSSGSESPIKVSGTFIPPEGQITTKHFGLDLQAQTIGSLYPDKSGPSIITVTGTKGTFISPDSTTDLVFPVYTGSYISGHENPTTYKFFFGNHPLTSDVQVILPSATANAGDLTESFDAEESEFQASLSRRSDGIDNLLLDSSIEKEIPQPYYRSQNKSNLYHETIPISRAETNPAVVTRFVQPTAYPETDEPVLAVAGRNTVGIVGTIRKQETHTLRGHHGHYRQGRMYNPTPSGRRIGQYGSSVVADQYFFPGHRADNSHVEDSSDRDFNNAYYDINDGKLRDQLRKIVRPSVVKDSRLTRTVGLYGPIYEIDDIKSDANGHKYPETDSSLSLEDSQDESRDADFTTTLYGFADFSTRISGTHYIFLPASTRPRTFTPRVTRTSFTNGIPIIPRSQTSSSKTESTTEAFFRKPLFGTETREFISQNSMFTSTIKEPVEIQKTMFTSTVMTKQMSEEQPKLRNFENIETKSVIAETLPLNLATVYERENMRSKYTEDRDLFLNFKPVKMHEHLTSNPIELDVSEIIDVKDETFNIEPAYPTGLVSSITGTEISDGTTTHWTTLIIGTYIDNTYAHVIESTSSIFFTVSKTASPGETLSMDVTANDENYLDTSENINSNNPIQLFSSLSDLSSSATLTTKERENNILATPTLEILTSGFILPRNARNEDFDLSSVHSFEPTETVMPTDLLPVVVHVTPEVVYADDEDEPENLPEANSSEEDSMHIITDSFIFPGAINLSPSSGNEDVKSKDESDTNPKVSSSFLSDLDRLIIGLPSVENTNEKSDKMSEDSVEESGSESGKPFSTNESTPKLVFLTGDFILPKSSVSKESSNDYSLEANMEHLKSRTTTSILTGGFILPSTPKLQLSSTESELPASGTLEDVTSASIITGGFILPSKPDFDDSTIKSFDNENSFFSSSLETPSILTDGFILPSQSMPESNSDSSNTTESSLSILTDGFILPGANSEFKSSETPAPVIHALPSSALLTAEPPSDDDFNEIEGRSAGKDEKTIMFDSTLSMSIDDSPSLSANSKLSEDKSPTNSNEANFRTGKALYSVEESVEKPKADQILPAISFPITYFTTSTYFTTYLVDGSSVISSRKETVSHIYTDSEHLKLAKINPTETIIMPESIAPTKTENPEDFLTTFTYYTTFYKDGSKIVTSRIETEGEILKETPTPVVESQPAYSVLTYPTTYYTTLTYFTTLLRGSSSEVISSETVVSNVVTPLASNNENIKPSEIIRTAPTTALQTPTTYFTTYTYYTTFHKDGTTSVSTNYQTVSNVIYGKENIVSTPTSSTYKTDDPVQDENYVPTTYFTTYTYYTTFLRGGTPIVSSREETVSNVERAKATETTQLSTQSIDSNTSPPKETTYFTTYTYYTTLLKDGTTTVSTRKETVSNVLGKTSSVTPLIVRTESPGENIKPTPQVKSYFTTYTYYTTFLRDGSPIVSTRESTVTNVVTESLPNTFSTISVAPTRSFTTYFTTLTSYYTLFNAGIPTVNTVYNTLTDVVALETPVQDIKSTFTSKSVIPSPLVTTYYTTYTYFTTLLSSSTPVVSTREVVTSNIVTLSDLKSTSSEHATVTPFSVLDSEKVQPTAVLTKTFYTTYTFFTTYLSKGTPSVSTKHETVTNYVTETISRTISQSETPSLSTKIFPSNVHGSFVETTPVPAVLNPTTVYSTFTYFTTLLSGDTSVVKSNTQVVSTVLNAPRITESYEKVVIEPSTAVNTIYTTFTYYTTLFSDGRPEIQTRYETKSNMITLTITPTVTDKITVTSDLDAAEGELHENRVQPTPATTYYTTHSYITTSVNPDGKTSFITRQVVASATIEKDTNKEIILEPSTLDQCCSETTKYPYTFYTTYTYYTTRIHGDRPIVNTRFETITNVIKAPVTAPLSNEVKVTSALYSDNAYLSSDINDIKTLHSSVTRVIPVSDILIVTSSINENEPSKENSQTIKSRKEDTTDNTTLSDKMDDNLLNRMDNTENLIDIENPRPTSEIPNKETVTESSDSINNPTTSSTISSTTEEATKEEDITSIVTEPSLTSLESENTTDLHNETITESISREETVEMTTESTTNEVSLGSTHNDIENKTEMTTQEITTTTTAAPTEVPVRGIFTRRRNRPQYKPRPSFRSSTTAATTSTTSRSISRTTTTSRPAVNINRRNTTRLLYRRPSLAPRVNPLQRFRPLRTTPGSADTEEENKRRKRSFFNIDDCEDMPKTRKILSTSDENNESILKNNDLISENRNADRRNNEKDNYPLGLIRSMDSKAINNGVTTVYATEIHGTFINGVYAQVVQSKVRVYSDTSNEIAKTPFFTPTVSSAPEKRSETETNKVGLVSSKLSTLVKDHTTTVYTTNIYGTYIGEVYAHLAQTTSNIITPTPTTHNPYPTGLISSSIRSEINYGTTTLWTTQIYGTFVNNYYAHIASTFSNILVENDKSTPSLTPGQYQYASATPDPRPATPTGRSVDNIKEYKTGLLSSIVSEDERDGTTTQYVTNIYGTYIGQQYAKHAQTTSKIILPTKSESSPTRSVGLLSTLVNSIINGNTATIYKTEIFGTYIGQLYAQLARTSTEYSYIHKQSTPSISPQVLQKTGLLTSSVVRSEINEGTTTMHINEIYGTYIGNAYAHVAKSTSKVIKPTQIESKTPSSESSQKTGLISSSVKTEVNDGTTTLHIAEVHGTYVGNYYAHVARRTSSVLPFVPTPTSTTEDTPTSTLKSEGLISSEVRTEINQGTTTLHTREIHGTYINGFYAHVARSSSNIITPTALPSTTNSGLVSAITNTEINDGLTTLHTTEIYGTSINGFYAHIARSTSNVITPTPTQRPIGILATTTSTEINNRDTTLHRTSVIGLEVDGTYMQSTKVTSSIIYGPHLYPESIINSIFSSEPKVMQISSAKDDLDTAKVNELDNGHQYISLTEDSDLGLKTPLTIPKELAILSPSIATENTFIETISTFSPKLVSIDTSSFSTIELKDIFTTDEISESTNTFSKASSDRSEKEEPTKAMKSEENSSKEPSDDYNDYNDYVDNKTFKEKESITLKPILREQNPRKNKAPSLASSRKVEPEDDYDEYAFEEDDYDGFESRKFTRKPTPSLASSRFKNTRQSKRKSATIGNGDYDDYDDYDYHESDTAEEHTSTSSEAAASKETVSSSVRIRPFTGRGRLTYSTPSRSSSKASFTIQFRRPSRTRNSRAFGHRSDSENDFDDDLNEEEEEGDIEASEAVVTTATPQVLSFSRRKHFGSSRYQPPGRNSIASSSSTTRPVTLNRNRRPFGRSTATSPSPTPSTKDTVPDYDENTTEDDDFDDYDDFSDKKDANKGSRNFRSTRRPPSRVTRFGERRSASNKRGSIRHREEEETENDDFDATTPNYRNSRNRINQRKPSRGRYNRNNSPLLKSSFNSVSRDEDEDSQSLQPINRIRGNNRNRRPSYNPRTRRPSKTVTETPTIKKPYLTVTSVVTTVKTLPIYHGFRTSYATLTTTALDTSIIHPTQYSEIVNDEGVTKTIFYSKTGYPDGIENLHTTITEVVVTTTSLASVKLVPIKIGFSTRTDTITDIQVLTTLSTVYSTITPDTPQPTAFPQQFQPNFYPQLGPQNPDFGLLASANSFVTTQIVTSTTVVPIILRGRTILSTLTTTSTSESTVVQTVRLPQVPSPAPFIPQPYFAFQPLTTLLTLYVTGEHGELKPVVTTVTVPLYQQPVFHTKVARSLQQNAISEHTLKTADFMDLPLSSSVAHDYTKDIDIDTHYDKLLSSGLEEINDLSEKSSSQRQTEPLDSTRISNIPYGVTTYDVTTISKGPLTEIYEQKVTVNMNTDDESMQQNEIERSKDVYGLESRYSFRKLQQFIEEEQVFRPQRDFTRIRRPPPGIILATAPNPDILLQPNTQSVPIRIRPRQFPPARRQPIEIISDGISEPDSIRNNVRGSVIRRPLRRPDGNFRPFIERPTEILVTANEETRNPVSSSILEEPIRLNSESENNFESERPVNVNGDGDRGFIGSPNEGDGNDGFKPISNPRGLRRGPGPILNELNPSSEVGLRSRRLRITRPVNGDLTSGVVRRITRVRSPILITSSASIDENDIVSSPSYVVASPVLFEPSSTNEPNFSSGFSNRENAVTDNVEVIDKENESDDEENTTSRRTVIRRLRPSFVPGDGSGGRRPVVVRRTRINEKVSSSNGETDILTSGILSSSFETPVSPTLEISTPEVLIADTEEEEDNEEDLNGVSKPPVKKIIRLRKPENGEHAPSGPRRRIVISRRPQDVIAANTVQARGPVTSVDITGDKENSNVISDKNHLVPDSDHDIEDFNKIVAIPSRNLEILPVYSTKAYPITYYTTLTYFTTFLHGPEINYASRVAVFSNIVEHTLDPSLINAISLNREQNRQPSPVNTVHLASRTLGDTTTIVNLASRQSIFNSDLEKLLTEETPVNKITPTVSVSENTRDAAAERSNINVIAALPKTFFTLFTYSYTFFDGANRRESTRAETMTKVNADPSQFLSESVGSYINRDGLLNVLPITRTLHLGSREVEGTTTEVNLGLKTLIKFDNVRNVVIETMQPFQYITPTRTHTLNTYTSSTEIPKASEFNVLSPVSLESSYASANDLFGTGRQQDASSETTPLISSDLPVVANTEEKKPIIKVTSVIHKPTGPLKSGVFNPRPGVRVRVKPVVSRRLVPSELVSSFDISFDVNEIASEYPGELPVSPQYIPPSVNIAAISTPALEESFHTNIMSSDIIRGDNELVSEDFDDNVATTEGAVLPSRKKLKVTVRRPQSESVSRTHTRFVLPSRFEITTRPRFYVVTRTGALGVVSNTQRPFTVKISRKLKPTATEVIPPSTTVIYDTYTTLTSVPVIFGLDTSFRNVLLTTSSPITVSFVPSPTFETDSPVIMPSTVILTYFTTTTFTIPYIVDDQTLFTTLEETNSRVVTSTLEGSDTPTYTTTTRPPIVDIPTLSLFTSVEFGFDGPVTHTLSSPSFATAYEEFPVSSIATFYETETPTLYETKTFYTTYTFFTTLFAGTEPVVSSSEQVVTNVITVPVTTEGPQPSSVVPDIVEPLTIFDTSETVITKTEYNTVTFYATLFSDTSSFVTPIEEIQTDVKTITETFTITKTILPTPSATFVPTVATPTTEITSFVPEPEPSVVVTQTLYTTFTNFVTLFQGTDTVVTNLEEIVSNVVTMTVPAHAASSFATTTEPTSTTESFEIMTTETTPPVYTTREVVSTQTHYLTLFNNDESLLSSITELVTSYVTELATPLTPSYTSYIPFVPESRFISTPEVTELSSETLLSSSELFTPFTRETTEETTSEISTYHPELVPSIRTIYSTLTFYTTYYSDTSSIVASQEEVLTSFVTLFVPPSLITTTTTETTTESIVPTSTSDPSVFVFTTTDYSTLTLYTTLFSGDEIVVISSEHVVPEVITATITPSSIAPTETSTKDESVLTFLTTFTYYTTYFRGTDPVIASSESVVTQFVTIEAPPTISPSIESIEATPIEETILGVSTVSTANIVSSFDYIPSDIEIIGVSSAVASGSEIEPTVETRIQVESKVHTEVGSSTVLSSPVLTSADVFESPIITLEEEKSSVVIEPSTSEVTSDQKVSTVSTPEDSLSEILLNPLKDNNLPVTTTSILTEKTEIVGLDGIVTSLVPSDTLVMVTGTDGFVTKLAEIDSVVLSPVYIPPTEQISPTSSSEIKPATVIELSDLLGGNTALGGDIGLAIKDIVSLITGKKNKTEEGVTTEKVTDSTDEDHSVTETTTESSDSILEGSTESDTSVETTTETDGTEEVGVAPKELDYPIFVLPTKESESKTASDILAPVYVPAETISTMKVDASKSTESSTLSDTDKSVVKVSKSVSTSVITGARTVFIIPTKASSSSDENKDRYTIETRVPKIDTKKETSPASMTKETSEISIETTKSSSTPYFRLTKEFEIPSSQVTKEVPSLTSVRTSETSITSDINLKTFLTSSMSSPSTEDMIDTTPLLKPSIGTSVVSGIRTVFFDPELNKAPKSQKDASSSTAKDDILGRANAAVSSAKSFTTLTKDGQTVVSRSTSGATTIFFPGQIPKYTMPVISTRYITSVESITRTLALTTTRTYYTRDSTLTVPSVYTTTIPPRTFVSTIIGSRTILGILPEPTETVQIHKTIEPSERTTTVTTTTLIFNSIPSTVIRTLVLPTVPTKTVRSDTSSSYTLSDANVFSAGTERPAKPPEVGDSTAVANDEITEVKIAGLKPVQKARDETYLRAANPRIRDDHPDMHLQEIHRPPIVVTEAVRPEDDPFLNGRNGICDPKCQPYKKEICKESDGLWTCQCRPGHARKDEHDICKEIQTFVVLLKVVKVGNDSVEFNGGLANNGSEEFKEFAKNAREGIADAYSITSVKDHIWDAEVNEIMPIGGIKPENDGRETTTVSPESGVIVNFTLQVSKSVSGKLLEQELTRALQITHMRVGDSALLAAPLSQSVQDYNECLDVRQNDCSLQAVCINELGSYTCKCNEGFEDMDANLPGRICLAKTENCNYCHGRGDCLRDDEKTFCRCQPMFVGRRCEINGLVLAIALPTAVAVVVLLLCAVLCCCRKCKKKSPNANTGDPGSVFRGIALKGPIGGTLDRKAMIDTSSESSGEHGRKGPMPFDGYQESGDVTPHKSSKRSDLSLNRSLSTGYTSPPVMIPRAKQPQIPNKPMNYTVYDGQVYVW